MTRKPRRRPAPVAPDRDGTRLRPRFVLPKIPERFAFLADTHEERLRLWTNRLLIASTPSLTLKAEARVLTEAVASKCAPERTVQSLWWGHSRGWSLR